MAILHSVLRKIGFAPAALFFGITLSNAPGICSATIDVGISVPISGPVKELGQSIRDGIEAYFNEVNARGGVHGVKLRLIVRDDQYEPYITKQNMLSLTAKKDVIAILGNFGTPTAHEAVPIANERKTLLLGAISGGEILRKDPPDRYVINFRASYAQETSTTIYALMEAGIKPEEIAFLTQNDSFGDAGYIGAVHALEKLGVSRDRIKQIPRGIYPRNTVLIEPALEAILGKGRNIKAFVLVATYQPAAAFIKAAKEYFPQAYYINTSLAGSEALDKAFCRKNTVLCDEYSRRVLITQVLPNFTSNLPAAKEFVAAFTKYFPDKKPNFVSFEGFVIAKLFVMGLEKAGPQPTRESLIKALEDMGNFDLGLGYPLFLSKEKHQASDRVWPTRLNRNAIEDFDWKWIKP